MPMFLHREFPFPEEVHDVCPACGNLTQFCACKDASKDARTEHRDLTDECDVCTLPVEMCVCRPCPTCNDVGNPLCYKEHGLMYTKQQIISTTQAHIAELEDELEDLYMYLTDIQSLPDDYETAEENILF